MIVSKFGGTAVTGENLFRIKNIVRSDSNRKLIVVSAVGKSHPNDVKATDLLKNYFVTKNELYFEKFKKKYENLCQASGVNFDLEKEFSITKKQILHENSLAFAMSKGEELSAKIVAKYLSFEYLPAENYVFFENGKCNIQKTQKAFQLLAKSPQMGVIGGFYGAEGKTRQTFSRGGSDVTASLLASGVGATLCENWTDVNGCMVASPQKVFLPKRIESLSYNDVATMCSLGAEVLHFDAINPLKKANIPLTVRNFYNTNDLGTLISFISTPNEVLSITTQKVRKGYLCKIVFTKAPSQMLHCLAKCCKNEKLQLWKATIEKNCLTVLCAKDCTNTFYNYFVG